MNQHPLQIVSSSAHDLFHRTLEALLEGENVSSVRQKNTIGSAWGTRERPTRELRYVTLVLENPCDRIVNATEFHLEHAIPRTILSTLSDEISLDVLEYYNPRAAEFCDDGKTIPTNYGYRIRHFDEKDQLQLVINQFKEDPYTRRAIIHIHSAGDHVRRYAPCINSLHFLIRDGALECQAIWRSENALTLLPYNLFEFTMLQELVASELQVPVGCFVQTITSLHYYLEDHDRLEANLKELEVNARPRPMPPMPSHSLAQITCIRKFEGKLRLNPETVPEKNGLLDYWQEIADILCFYVFNKIELPEKAFSALEHSPWKELILQKKNRGAVNLAKS